MKNILLISIFLLNFSATNLTTEQASWIRINNLGYLPGSTKVAVLVSKTVLNPTTFSLHDVFTDEQVFTSQKIESKGAFGPFKTGYRLNFSDFRQKGKYYIKVGQVISPEIRIHKQVYDHTADFLLKYMRQQRCGYNPFLTDSCHLDDGYIIYHPTKTGERIDVTGGWHDATDYLQYTATSANAVFQLLFAYQENPEVFGDAYQANGLPGPNGIPDVIDEAKFGMDWLKRMNPSPTEYYNQIADDRDHAGFRLPNKDSVVYNENYKGRPVYLASAEKQGLKKYQNRSTGVASTAGKFASAFALGAAILPDFFPEYSEDLQKRAEDAFKYGMANPGVSQTAPCKGPYFYEEDNWLDDMELAASQLFKVTGKEFYKKEGLKFASAEKLTPWIGRDSVSHYQYYPFLNVGHFEFAQSTKNMDKAQVISYYKEGLETLYQRGKENPFFIGTPLVWCSNHFVSAGMTQAKLYREITNDNQYLEMEAALRDWLFGCNPWGTTMIVGLPNYADSPVKPHSSLLILNGYQTYGGLVDGPVYGSIFKKLIGLELYEEDSYAEFQSDFVVYHDDAGDYSTNEPTMDGTASLVYYLSAMEKESLEKGHVKKAYTYDGSGAIIRGDKSKKQINLVFTGDQFGDGAEVILNTLKKYNIQGSFFLTGNFYRNEVFHDFIQKAQKDGHYLGAHSDKHLLYNDWTKEKKRLVSHDEFTLDLLNNYKEMERFGILKENAPYFLPPYEWNDEMITQWTAQLDLQLINYSPGTISHADYTTPEMENYKGSEVILQSIFELEEKEGLNGFMLLSHIGTNPDRKDKFYLKLDQMIQSIQKKGYEFVSLPELLRLKPD
ncbi:glycoside hydrolase family 9 protein [Flexithrix dorotheae]|uniref:glycoside hydrolase family 9 protein n=1 Tax=Flexithrix dorotheae TaxID=70993 RepID=UPI000370C41B|nr:glycoside hydrolase family 9 protein [Flexithrix dorotheae]